MHFKIYTDGWSRWNPWIAWIWVYITNEKWNELEKRYKYLWIKTNNEAEYSWAYLGIKRWLELWAKQIDLYMDSNLVIKQLLWEWKIKKKELQEIYNQIQELLKNNKTKINYIWIPREQNIEADRLSNIAMDKWI